MKISSDIPLPAYRVYKKRLTPELKRLQIGESVLLDEETANALIQYFRFHGQRGTRRAVGRKVRIWRVS